MLGADADLKFIVPSSFLWCHYFHLNGSETPSSVENFNHSSSNMAILVRPDEVPKSLECCICLEVPTSEPTILKPCSHVFCRNCIRTSISTTNKTCPTCRCKISKDTDLLPLESCPFAHRQWSKIAVRCEHHPRCPWTGSLDDYRSHTESCVLHLAPSLKEENVRLKSVIENMQRSEKKRSRSHEKELERSKSRYVTLKKKIEGSHRKLRTELDCAKDMNVSLQETIESMQRTEQERSRSHEQELERSKLRYEAIQKRLEGCQQKLKTELNAKNNEISDLQKKLTENHSKRENETRHPRIGNAKKRRTTQQALTFPVYFYDSDSDDDIEVQSVASRRSSRSANRKLSMGRRQTKINDEAEVDDDISVVTSSRGSVAIKLTSDTREEIPRGWVEFMTVKQLQEELKKRKVPFSSKLRKKDLQDLLEEDSL